MGHRHAYLIVGLLIAGALNLSADEKWTEFRSGPISVFTNAGDREGRATLTDIEQLRFVLGEITGKKDLKAQWPLRVLLTKGASVGSFALGRDAEMVSLPPAPNLPPSMIKQLTMLWLEPNTPGLPPIVAEGLPVLLSTIKVQATKVTLGAPPPKSEQTPAWALLHLVAVDPQYAGRLRVFLSNASNGMDLSTASKNAFEKPLAEMQKQAASMLEQGQFGTISAPSRPISPERDFPARPLSGRQARLAQADLALANQDFKGALPLYRAAAKEQTDSTEALDGAALALAGLHDEKAAKDELLGAVQKNSTSARVYYALGLLETELAEKRTYLQKATELNPAWDLPYYAWAQIEKDPHRKAPLLGKAAKDAPGNARYWQEYALALEAADQFSDAARAWSAAERAVPTEEDREKIRRARQHADTMRLDAEIAARKKAEEDRERDIQRAKNNALTAIREAEEKANGELAKNRTSVSTAAPVRWEELDGSLIKVNGDLQRIDCVGDQWKLTVTNGPRRSVVLLVTDPAAYKEKLACGVQKPPRKVEVEYTPKKNPKLGTAGEVGTIEVH